MEFPKVVQHVVYEELEVWQAQTTFLQFFDQAFGAQRVTFIGESGRKPRGGFTKPR